MSKNKNPFIKMAEMIPPISNIAISTIYLADAFCNYSSVPSTGKINLTTVPSFEDLSIQIVPP